MWLAIVGVAALVALSLAGQVRLEALHVVTIVTALIGGQALEGFGAALKR